MVKKRVSTKVKRRYVRRRYQRKRRLNKIGGKKYSSMITVHPKGDTVVADKIFVKLVYSDTIDLTSTSGSIGTLQWRGNSLYDPYLTGVGHQPRFFDQLSTLYNEYMVYGCKVKVLLRNTSSAPGIASIMATSNDSGYGVPTSINDVVERGVPYREVSDRVVRLQSYFSVSKIWGLSKERVRDDSGFRAAVSGNPSFQTIISLLYQSADQTSTSSVNGNVVITYYAAFTSPKYLTGS